MSGMKFRRTCAICNTTFFTPDRRQSICSKCLKKRGASKEGAPSGGENRFARPASGPAGSMARPERSERSYSPGGAGGQSTGYSRGAPGPNRFRGPGGPGGPGGQGGHNRPSGGRPGAGGKFKPKGSPAPASKSTKIPKPPKVSVMSEELRQRIMEAYKQFIESTE